MLIESWGTNVKVIVKKIQHLLKKMTLKLLSGEWRPFCLGLNVSIATWLTRPLNLPSTQASPEHLLSAAIMSAPAALAMAKLSYPEIEVSHTRTSEDVYMEKTCVHGETAKIIRSDYILIPCCSPFSFDVTVDFFHKCSPWTTFSSLVNSDRSSVYPGRCCGICIIVLYWTML